MLSYSRLPTRNSSRLLEAVEAKSEESLVWNISQVHSSTLIQKQIRCLAKLHSDILAWGSREISFEEANSLITQSHEKVIRLAFPGNEAVTRFHWKVMLSPFKWRDDSLTLASNMVPFQFEN